MGSLSEEVRTEVLCGHICDLEAENARLRTQLADVTESMGRVEERCAKLRSMVHDMRYCIKRNHRCDNCDFNVGTDCLLFVNINKRMRELGIEV